MSSPTLSIQSKITLLASLCLILVVGLLVGLSLYQTRASTERVKDSSASMLAEAARLNLQAQGKVQALLELPLSGLLSDAPLEEVARAFAAVRTAADRIVDWQPPYLVFKAVFGATLACNAGPHQTDRGIADGTTGALLESPILSVRTAS